ncbi:MAG: radical SAM protein [Rickettsiales bacterium]|jgi:MoaA/NifB/PqqE/SkfB family radical SAM enzyme|nr:radical SAM protein [Rickettsiales bacterium]
MPYDLKKDVFIVKGHKKCLLYDLSQGRLFHIDMEDYNKMKKVFGDDSANFSKEERETEEFLLTNGLVNRVEKAKKRLTSIKSIREERKPTFAWIEATQQCNLKCVFCYEESDYCAVKCMSLEDFQKAKNFLINCGVSMIQFIGGEPMLNPRLGDMIKESRGKFNFIEVYTNGTMINQEWCDFFKEYKVSLAISFHSFIEKEFEKITQTKGSFNLVKRGLDLAIKNKLPLRVASIQNKDVNIGEKPDDFQIRLRSQPPRLIGRGKIDQFNLAMFREVAITKESFRKKVSRGQVVASVSGHQCFSKDLYVAYNLEVFPCVMERRISHGFITDESNPDLIKKEICGFNKDRVKGCKNCEFRYICHDCRPNCNGGDINSKPWNCAYDPMTGEWGDVDLIFEKLVSVN